MPVLRCCVLLTLRIQIRVLEYGCCHTKVTRGSRVTGHFGQVPQYAWKVGGSAEIPFIFCPSRYF